MSYNQAHHKPKQVGVPSHQVYQPRHQTAPRHQPQTYRQPPQGRDTRQYTNQPPRHPSPIPGQSQGPGLPGHPPPSASPSGSVPQQPTALGTAGAPHDMNKQGVPNRPALTPSPVQQGTIIPGQPMIINPSQIMYAQQNMQRGGQQTVAYITNPRTNPRSGMPLSNMTQSQQGGQPQATYPTNPQMTMAAPPFIPSSHHVAPPPAQYMMQQQMMMQPQSNLECPVKREEQPCSDNGMNGLSEFQQQYLEIEKARLELEREKVDVLKEIRDALLNKD